VNPLSPGESGQPEPKEFGILLYLRQRSDLGYFLVEAIRGISFDSSIAYHWFGIIRTPPALISLL
jgi:hypothetical protein